MVPTRWTRVPAGPYAGGMTSVIAIVSDLFFASRIQTALVGQGDAVRVVESRQTLEAALRESGADLVVLDLDAGVAAADVVAVCRLASAPVLAFGRHTEAAMLREARKAGCVEALPRSVFFEDIGASVRRFAGAERSPGSETAS